MLAKRSLPRDLLLMQKETTKNLSEVEGKLGAMPKTEIELIAIKRQFSIKEGLFLYLLQKRSETAIILASSTSNNWIVDKAVPSYTLEKPVKSKSYAIAFVLALLITGSLALAL